MIVTIAGWTFVVFLIVGFVVNGVFMISSPRVWCRLPGWVAWRGSLTEKRYGHGLGALQVRLVGAILVIAPLYCIYDACFR